MLRHNLYTCMVFLQYGYEGGSAVKHSGQMQQYKLHMQMVSPQYVCACDSSSVYLLQMNPGIYHICKVFHQCESSCGLLSAKNVKNSAHILSTCMASLLCEFCGEP